MGGRASRSTITRQDYLSEVWFLRIDAAGLVFTDRATWRRGETSGASPCGRAGHAALAVGPHVVIAGGVNAQRFLADLHVFHAGVLGGSQPLGRVDLEFRQDLGAATRSVRTRPTLH